MPLVPTQELRDRFTAIRSTLKHGKVTSVEEYVALLREKYFLEAVCFRAGSDFAMPKEDFYHYRSTCSITSIWLNPDRDLFSRLPKNQHESARIKLEKMCAGLTRYPGDPDRFGPSLQAFFLWGIPYTWMFLFVRTEQVGLNPWLQLFNWKFWISGFIWVYAVFKYPAKDPIVELRRSINTVCGTLVMAISAFGAGPVGKTQKPDPTNNGSPFRFTMD
ncbi:MAG: hypothetical protein COT91_04160 [Candidatus Doudnabacteria bacterium CG10_big_fil_rev_8_21_14_0_10_41_10]|uniref:Uncharacterized protein n=1 Tax=Candidatus Doudnabacteria bacterium CG10_big_fil_rev_8_21_14_0_10_41_10 TaxID=1974551 RepID=A0A2H0VCV1_9BACT|nr:MAG: hypothetical protein COT91_04160 [Candidatus Doudnabacteria bacterium CG10_big_fil_rev_8_21_14_0_10_41_10]